MAKKARKTSAARLRKKSKPSRKKAAHKTARSKRKSKAAAKKKTVRKARPKRKPRTIGDRLASAYHTMIDTVKETERLRNKYEPPGTTETE